MSSKFVNELSELTENNVISREVAHSIEAYYKNQRIDKPSRLFTVFGVLGATLVGLGIILILAHNWDDFSRTIKTICAFLPLVIGQLFVGYSILNEKSETWKEASGVFLFFSVGACMALVSQIYNIPGDLSSFLLSWIVLGAPLIYLLKSRAIAILHIVLSTYYVFEFGYSSGLDTPWLYLLLLVIWIPFYLQLLKNQSASNMASIFNWLLPLSMTICLGAFVGRSGFYGYLMYVILFGIFYNLGKIPYLHNQKLRRNGYLVIGSLGTVITLLIATFRWFWEEVARDAPSVSQAMYVAIVLFLMALGVLAYSYSKKWIKEFNLFRYIFILFTILFFIGIADEVIPTIVSNLLVLTSGLMAIKIGADRFHFGILNYGLLIVTSLVICRFFDTNMTFVIRGLLFVIVGLGFFLTNYIMLKKQKSKTL